MKNTFGNSITLTLFGESHGEYIGAVLDGIAPGIKIDTEYIKRKLDMRRPRGKISTARVEGDGYEIVSGAKDGFTTGSSLCLLIKNENRRSGDYAALADTPRPSHADYAAHCKYRGFEDARGGGHFSGRITAAVVAVCAILESALRDKGIYVGTHIKELHGVKDSAFSDYSADIKVLDTRLFPTLSTDAEAEMMSVIEAAAGNGDSVGGILESAIIGVPAGVGEPWFDSLESMLAHALFSIPAVKGVEFGLGFGFADKYGSDANDAFATDGEKIYTKSNNNGGINGGISNGMPIIFSTAIKPTPSIFKEQDTVSLARMENAKLSLSGRHDPAIIHRARAVVDALAAFVVADMLTVKFGTDYLANS